MELNLSMPLTLHSRKSQKKGVDTVLTTLIIISASIVLGLVVAQFEISLFQSAAQNKSIIVSNAHLWYQTNATVPQVEGAFVVRNTGDRTIAVDTIRIRGITVPFGNWAVSATTVTPPQTTAQFIWQPGIPAANTYNLDGVGTNVALTAQNGPISIDPGKSAIIYFNLPATQTVITPADIDTSIVLAVSASQIDSVQSISVAKA